MVYKGIGIFALLSMGIAYASVKENLDYLFESKFPISDYVWQQKGTHQGDLSKSNIFNQSHMQPNLTMLTDELGNPIFDENGDPIYIDKEGNMYSGEGKKILDKKILLDKTGKPILDKNGNHIFIDKNGNLKDKNDNPILDSNGNPININNKEALNEFLNKNTQNSPEEQLRRQQELLAEAQRQAELQEQMRKKLEEEARKKAEEEMKKLADPTYQALLAKQEEDRARRLALATDRV